MANSLRSADEIVRRVITEQGLKSASRQIR